MDQQLKQLMKELGEAINESLADSEQIAEVVSRIKDGGYDIFLVLEATIGVSKPGEKTSRQDFTGNHADQQSPTQYQRSGPEVSQVPSHQDRRRRRIVSGAYSSRIPALVGSIEPALPDIRHVEFASFLAACILTTGRIAGGSYLANSISSRKIARRAYCNRSDLSCMDGRQFVPN